MFDPNKVPDSYRSRGWIFTWNNYKPEDWESMQSIKCQYLVVAQEVGEKGTPHLQGFVYFKNAKTKRTVRKKVVPGANVAPNMKDALVQRNYCLKLREEDPIPNEVYIEMGERPQTRKEVGETQQKKWEAIRDTAKAGNLDDIEAGVFVRSYRTLRQIAFDYSKPCEDLEDCCGYWIYGDHGTGKSTLARSLGEYYVKSLDLWWDGYQGEENVILEDMDPFHKSMGRDIKLWADKYALNVPVKGGYRRARPKRIIVTSQYSPEEIWDDEKTVSAIRDRFVFTELRGESFRVGKKKCRETIDQILANKKQKISSQKSAQILDEEENYGSQQEIEGPLASVSACPRSRTL